MTLPEEAMKAAKKRWLEMADDANLEKHGPDAATYTLDDMLSQALTAAGPHIRAQELSEFIKEANTSSAVTWSGHGGVKELAIKRHNRLSEGETS